MIEEQILTRLRGYSMAFYQKDFDTVIDYLYPDEIKSLRDNLQWMAQMLSPFGETDGFLNLFKGLKSLNELKTLTDKQFIAMFFSGATRKLSQDKIVEMVNTMEILEIDHAEYIANVKYAFNNVFSDMDYRIESEVNLILSEGEWFVLFNTGMEENFERYKRQLKHYENAKRKDNLNLSSTPDEDVELYSIYGYRTYDEDIIIEPRFKNAGEFSDGLAPVKIFSKWGYINKKGEIAIVPKYTRAEVFSEGFAVIGQVQPEIFHLYGFIDKTGTPITKCIYREAFSFSEGLAAVRLNDIWGFINKKGKMAIGFQYDEVESFENGEAIVEIDDNRFVVDKKGNVLRELANEWDEDDWDDEEEDEDDIDFRDLF
ncbi:MAG: WG repeat-containing protein [Saprospiraceae bacterium]